MFPEALAVLIAGRARHLRGDLCGAHSAAAAGILDWVRRSSVRATAEVSSSRHRAVRFCGRSELERIKSTSCSSFFSAASSRCDVIRYDTGHSGDWQAVAVSHQCTFQKPPTGCFAWRSRHPATYNNRFFPIHRTPDYASLVSALYSYSARSACRR